MSTARRLGTALILVLALLVAACGSRRSQAEIAAAAGGGRTEHASDFPTGDAASPDQPAPGSTDADSSGNSPSSVPAGTGADGGGQTSTTVGTVAAGATCPNGPLKPVKVGHIGGYDGLVGATINGGLETAQVWARSVNSRGGLNCHPVELIAVNDRNDPNTNAALVRELVEQRGVIAFVGNLTPLSITGGLKYLEQHQIPIIGGELTHPAWGTSPMAFPQGAFTNVGSPGSMREGVKTARARGIPNPERTAFLVCEVEACLQANVPIKAQDGHGYQLVYNPSISLTQTNFVNECREAARRNVGTFFVAGVGATLEAAANSCADQGYRPQFVTYSLAIQNSLAGNPNLEHVVGASPTFPWMLTTGVGAEYGDALARYAPRLVTSGASSVVWTAGKLMEAASRSLPANPTSADVLAGLRALNGETLGGLTGPLTFRGGSNNNAPCYFVVEVRQGKWIAPRGSECISG